MADAWRNDAELLLRRMLQTASPPDAAEWSSMLQHAGALLLGGDDTNSEIQESSRQDDVVHLAVLWSAPLVRRMHDQRMAVLAPIDHDAVAVPFLVILQCLTPRSLQELSILRDGLVDARRAVRVQNACATADMLRSLISGGVRVLHVSGHGIVDEQGRDFLVFEAHPNLSLP